MVSKALEEYLKNMYVLQVKNKEIRVTDIANSMNCSKPSVNKAINNLKEKGLVNYETYGKIELTESGQDLAKKILEAYDIVFLFFKDVINLPEEEAKNEAEKLKSTMEDNTINMLAKYVHKVLNLNDLSCNYDIAQERCRICARRTKLKRERIILEKELLKIENLYVNAGEKEILKGINLKINKGEIHVIMGPNGSGKTTTANAILNNPAYSKENGNIFLEGEDITNLKTDEIARKGVFMSFQSPEEIPGITTTNFLKYAKNKATGKPVKIFQFKDEIKKHMKELQMKPENAERSLNVGFSRRRKKEK